MNRHPRNPSPPATTVAGYLLARLAQAGLISVFGVPGDCNLGILESIAAQPGLNWIAMATEQGAGYAADSYARLRGIGAVVTTIGAGELSAMNAIAGAYAESVPVVHIVGTPALVSRTPGATLLDNRPGSDYNRFVRMAAEVTAAQADLRLGTAPTEIDRVLSTALRTSRPVYLTLPADVARATVPSPAGRLLWAGPQPDPAVVATFTGRVRRMLDSADNASLLIGHLAARRGAAEQVRDVAIAGNLPVAVLSTAKGNFPEADPRFAGLYAGPDSAKRARAAVEDADVLISVGVTVADTMLSGAPQIPHGHRIDLTLQEARIDGAVYPGIGLRQSLAIVATALRSIPSRSALADLPVPDAAPDALSGPLTQRSLWTRVQDFLRPGDLLIAEQGTAFHGAAGLTLPDSAQLVGQPLWASSGWSLPAALGASLAAPDRRVVLIAGAGAMRQTAAELGTLLGLGLLPVIIVLNHGSTHERAINQPGARYHEVPPWDWTALPAALGAVTPPVALRARTCEELACVLSAAGDHASEGRPVLIEALFDASDASDAPPLLQGLTQVLAA